MLKKNIATVIAGLIISGSVYSNNKMGMLTLNSTRHEPFDAMITVTHEKGRDLKLMKAQLGTIVDFYRHNLEPSFLNSNLSFSIKDKNDHEKIIHVTSDMPISAEHFGFVVRLYDNEEKSFGVYKLIPPVVDPMEDVEMVVCNSLNWDKNKDCMKAVNTELAAQRSIIPDQNEVYASNSNAIQVAEDAIDFKLESNSNKTIDEELLNKKEISKIENNEVEKSKTISTIKKEKNKTVTVNKNKKITVSPDKIEEKDTNRSKKVETAAMKKERTRLRNNLKPHMYQAKNKLPDYHSADASDIRDNLKPEISIKQSKKDSISKGFVKFSEILKVDQSEEKK